MKKLFLVLLLLALGMLAFGQSIPVCSPTSTTPCTDYFGSPNWANSPLPAGTITGFTLISGGSGYVNPQVVVTDPTGTGFPGATAALSGDMIISVTGTGGTGYTMPQVTIVDVGQGGSTAAPACGATGQPACGSGAIATAIVGAPWVHWHRHAQVPRPTEIAADRGCRNYFHLSELRFLRHRLGRSTP